MIRYLKRLRGNLDICLSYYLWSRNSGRVLSVADHDRRWKMLFWIALFGHSLAQFSRLPEKPEQANAPIITEVLVVSIFTRSCGVIFPSLKMEQLTPNLTVCPLHGPGNDSSVVELMYLTVCSLFGPGSIPGRGRVFQRIFPGLITICQSVLSQRGRK